MQTAPTSEIQNEPPAFLAAAFTCLRKHWPEYLIEACGLGVFIISACLFATLLEHPAAPVHRLVAEPVLRRALMGAAMGLTAITIIYSPWGQRSGAHLNAAVTFTFFRLGKIAPSDAAFYGYVLSFTARMLFSERSIRVLLRLSLQK
jgi:aquaporin Z